MFFALAAIIAAAAAFLDVTPASAAGCSTPGGCLQSAAPNCLQDEWNFQNGTTGKTLVCTAGDVKIAKALNPRDSKGNPVSQCVQGQTFSFIADFTVTTTATARENIGLYMATNQPGQTSALTGTCADNIISPLHDPGSNSVNSCSNTVGNTQCLGSTNYKEADASPDNCGDISTSDNNQVITVAIDGVKCEPPPGCNPATQNCSLVLPNCTSWQQPGGTILCESTPPNTGWPYVTAAVPGATSKCSCNSTFTVSQIQVLTPGLPVTKTANPTTITGTDGGTSTYTVTVTNDANAGSEQVNQICDNVYGTIATSAGQPPCSVTTATATNISCQSSGTAISAFPYTLAQPGDSLTCTFQGFVPENSTPLTDTVTVNAVASNGAPVSGTASASVTTGDAPASATFIKTLGSANPSSGCATVTYNVEVDNTSSATMTTDEDETLTALSDNVYGNITTTHGNASTNGSVLSTSCSVPQSILAGTEGKGGKYTCSFNGVICGSSLSSITTPTMCSAGVEVTDMLSGTLTGDETNETVSITPGSRTVEVCFSASSN